MDVENLKFKKRNNNSKLLQKWIIVECIIDDLLSRICWYVNDKIKAALEWLNYTTKNNLMMLQALI